ncbi:MAG: NADPH-dependent F420 reductase [Nitriliruptor sp.]
MTESTITADTPDVGILGGTGNLGAALAQRWSSAGLRVVIGSRDPERAVTRAAELRQDLPAEAGSLTGGSNADAATAPVVVAAIPTEGAGELVAPLSEQLAGGVLVSTLSPLEFDADGPRPGRVEAGSAAELLAAAAPSARVVAGFHTVSAVTLADLGRALDEDVLLCGDDEDALAEVAALVDDHLEGARAVVVGPLRLAVALEASTAVLISTNRRHRAHAGLRVTGL